MLVTTAFGAALAAAESVTVEIDDDSFTIGPWGTEGAVRDWCETIMWTHLCYRPFTGAAPAVGELEMVAPKSIAKIDDVTYAVELNQRITDSKGNAITAADVAYSYDKLADLGYITEIGLYYASAEVTGDYALTITLKNGAEGAIEEVLCGCSIAAKDWYENARQDEIESNPACTGPYAVAGVETGSAITMVARDDYWKSENLSYVEKQNVKNTVVRCIDEASMRTVALENGEMDMAEISATDVVRFGEGYNVTEYMNAMSQYLIFNTSENSPCRDENVRKAIAYGIDAMTIRLLNTVQALQGPYQVMQMMLGQVGINLEILAMDRSVRRTYQSDPTAWDIAEYSDMIADFTTHFWENLFSEKNYGEQGTRGFTVNPTLQELLTAAGADRSEENMCAFHDYVVEKCYMRGLDTEIRSIVTDSSITDICLHKLNPVLNAMTFAE